MIITSKPDQEARLQTQVATGDFASIEEAARLLLDERIAERRLEENDDLSWAKPHVDEGIAARFYSARASLLNVHAECLRAANSLEHKP